MGDSSSVYFDGLSDGSSWARVSHSSFLKIADSFSISAYVCGGINLKNPVPGAGLCVGFDDINKMQCAMITDVNGDTREGVHGGEPALAKLKSSVMAVMAARNGLIVVDIPLNDVVKKSLYSAQIRKIAVASSADYFYGNINIINANAERTLVYCEKTRAHTNDIDRRFQMLAFDNGVEGVSRAGEKWKVSDAWKSVGISTRNNLNGHACENILENHHNNIRLLKAEAVEPGKFFGYFLVNNELLPDYQNYKCSTSVRVEPVKYELTSCMKELSYHTCQSCYEAPTVCLPQDHDYYATYKLPQIVNVTTNSKDSTNFCVTRESKCDSFKITGGLKCQYTDGDTAVSTPEGTNGTAHNDTNGSDKVLTTSIVAAEMFAASCAMTILVMSVLIAFYKALHCRKSNARARAHISACAVEALEDSPPAYNSHDFSTSAERGEGGFMNQAYDAGESELNEEGSVRVQVLHEVNEATSSPAVESQEAVQVS